MQIPKEGVKKDLNIRKASSSDSNGEEEKKLSPLQEEAETDEYIKRMLKVFEDKDYECEKKN